MRKPDAAIYLHAARQLGRDPSECLFIDDRARNCEAARGCGMSAIEFDGDVDRLRATLAEQGWL
jgi:putative hydrolase of the HAD superfamily